MLALVQIRLKKTRGLIFVLVAFGGVQKWYLVWMWHLVLQWWKGARPGDRVFCVSVPA